MSKELGHWSDCAVYNEPAMPAGECNCGGLNLKDYDQFRVSHNDVPTPESLRMFVKNREENL